MINVAYAKTRVIEIASGLSAAVAGRFFADLGADVVQGGGARATAGPSG